MDDGVSETMHIASLGIDYTFKFIGTGADIAFQLVKHLCNKANLDRQEQRALDIAMRDQGSTTTVLKTEDRDDFVKLATQHGLEFQMADIATTQHPSGELFSVITPGKQISNLNAILGILGYGQPEVNSQSKNAYRSSSDSVPLKEDSLQDIVFDFASNTEAMKDFQKEHNITPVVPIPITETGHVTQRPGDELSGDDRETLPSRQSEIVHSSSQEDSPEPPVNVFVAAKEEKEEPVSFVDSLITHAEKEISKDKKQKEAASVIQIPVANNEQPTPLPTDVKKYLDGLEVQ